MAAASSPPFPLAVIIFLCYLLALCIHIPSATSFSFDFNFTSGSDQTNYTNLQFSRDASYQSPDPVAVQLTKDVREHNITDSMGSVCYKQLVPLWKNATRELASFTTSFSFQIKLDQGTPGDGMTFFLSHYPPELRKKSTSGGGSFGLFNSSQILTGDRRAVAVEFDTYTNPQMNDSSAPHIGIDINSAKSMASTGVSSHNLTSGSTMNATVKYDNVTKLLAVDLQINNTLYRVNYTVDLREELPENVLVGFSAATGDLLELHQVLSWSFSSTIEPPEIPTPAKSEPSKKLLLAVLVPVILVCAVVGLLIIVWQRKKLPTNPTTETTDGGDESDEEQDDRALLEMGVAGGPKRFLYRDLADATNNFADEGKLGRGGFGSVYRGLLRNEDKPDGVPVAIKLFASGSSTSHGRKQFEAEVRIISQIRHRNLVRLHGWCDSRKGLLLVYELVPGGSLDKHIYNTERLLTWSERYKIILGLGSALCYLHREWVQCVVHGDIKPSNIMLDSEYNTKLGDFGLARLIDHGKGSQTSTTKVVAGTAGYIDPDFVNTRRPSSRSDIYSFGVVLLEIVSGQQPVEHHEDAPPFMLLKWAWGLYGQNATIDAADQRLRGDVHDERQMERTLVVGLWCAHPDPSQRPSISQAMHFLQSDDSRLPALPPQMYVPLPLNFAMGENSLSAICSAAIGTDSGTPHDLQACLTVDIPR